MSKATNDLRILEQIHARILGYWNYITLYYGGGTLALQYSCHVRLRRCEDRLAKIKARA